MNHASIPKGIRRRIVPLGLALALAPAVAVGVAGCGGQLATVEPSSSQQTSVTSAVTAGEATTDQTSATAVVGDGSAATAVLTATAAASEAIIASYDDEDLDPNWDTATASQIVLAGESIRLDGTGATVNGSTLTITAPGTYVIRGVLSDGQIRVGSEAEGTVRLVLNGADITCATGAPLYVESADKVIITLADGTENRVTDGAPYTLEDSQADESNAAVFSKADLTINGSGSLTVKATYNNGIASKDDLKIIGGTITVDAVNDAIQGRDCVGVKAGTLTLLAGGDGIQATNDADAEKGYVSIEGGTFNVTSGTDAIQAQTTVAVSGGDFTISTGGGSGDGDIAATGGPGSAGNAAATGDSTSAKGLKAASGVFVSGGTFTLDTSDDAVHSHGTVKIDGGTFAISSGDDGVHADATLEINGGELTISQSYEGLESAVITINDGAIRLRSSDDGINVAGGADGSSVNGRPGQNAFAINEDNQLFINGGYIALDSGGDALDCNGRVFMTGGTVIANGPTNDGNGAIDYMGEFTVTGGYLVAVGSSGMAEAPSETSSQYSMMVNFDQVQQAGTLVHIESSTGEDVLTMAPTKQFQSVVLCSSAIQQGETYKVYLGGSSTGTVSDTVYSGGTYTPGTEYVSLAIEGMVTASGAAGGMGRGGRPGGDGPSGSTPPGRP
jgi:hypothetical protein